MRLAIYSTLIPFILYISGCAIGRSWDTPSISDSEIPIKLPKDITIYSRDNLFLIRGALVDDNSKREEASFIIKKLDKPDSDIYPRIIVGTQNPKYNDYMRWTFGPSFLTLSIIPGYFNESSDITLELIVKDDKGRIIRKSQTYSATRHYFNWLPLLPFANYGMIVIDEWGTSKTKLPWNEAYKHYIRKFILDNYKLIARYK